MKKIFLIIFVSMFLLPFLASAVCNGEAQEEIETSSGMRQCVCVSGAIGAYPDCHCPAGTEWYTDHCASTGGGSQGSACRVAGGDWVNGQCDCGTGYGWTGSSCYPCGVNIPEQGAFCGSGCAGRGGCGGGSANDNGANDSDDTGDTNIPTSGSIGNPITSGTFADLIGRIIDWIINIALVLAPLVIVYGGFIYMTAAGDTNKVSQGKNIILYASIGFIVALVAKSLVGILEDLVVK